MLSPRKSRTELGGVLRGRRNGRLASLLRPFPLRDHAEAEAAQPEIVAAEFPPECRLVPAPEKGEPRRRPPRRWTAESWRQITQGGAYRPRHLPGDAGEVVMPY